MEKTKTQVTKKKKNNDAELKETSIKNEEVSNDTEVIKKKKKKKNKELKDTKKKNKLKKYINNPIPIIIALCILCVIQLYFLFSFNASNKIYTGELNTNEMQVINLHMFINNDINYFYAAPAAYLGEEKEIYNFQIGYFIEMPDGELEPFAVRTRELENPSKLSEIVNEMSAWNFFETALQDYFFSEDAINNIENLHFIVKASTEKGSSNYDITLDYEVEVNKITK